MTAINLTIKSDNTMNNIRIVILEKDGYTITITYNYYHNNAYVKINSADNFFAPSIAKDKTGYTLTYGSTVIFPENRQEFENAYHNAVRFCDEIDADIKHIIEKLKNNKERLTL